jgi:hypothetical protein
MVQEEREKIILDTPDEAILEHTGIYDGGFDLYIRTLKILNQNLFQIEGAIVPCPLAEESSVVFSSLMSQYSGVGYNVIVPVIDEEIYVPVKGSDKLAYTFKAFRQTKRLFR